MKSTIGRPRAVTDAHIKTILAWHDAVLAFEAQRKALKTLRQLCQDLGLSKGTIYHVIRCRGELKQASPEHRQDELRLRHRHMKHLRARGHR